MLFYKLFLKIAVVFIFAACCASEIQAFPFGEDQTGPRKSIKRTIDGSEKKYQHTSAAAPTPSTLPVVERGQHFMSAGGPAREEYGSDIKKRKTFHKTTEEDAVLWAAVTAAEEVYYRTHPREAPLTPSFRTQGGEVSAYDQTPEEERALLQATIAAEEYYRTHPREAPQTPSLWTQGGEVSAYDQTPEEESVFLQAALAAEKEYYRTHSREAPLTPPSSDQESDSSQQVSYSTSSGISEGEAHSDQQEDFGGFRYRHLTTPRDHQQHLIDAINSANRSILITSYAFSADMREGRALFEAVRAACYRGVKLYFYANDIRLPDEEIAAMSRLRNLMFDEATIHSKLLVVDNRQITCGSYDWLAEPWRGRGTSQNASLILEGNELKPVVDRIWHVLKKYRSVDFSPDSFYRVERTLERLPPLGFQFENPEDSFELLNTPCEHGEFFEECFETAQNQLTICAPFITGVERFLQEILPRDMILSFLESGKQLRIFYREGHDKIGLLRKHLDQTLSGPYFRLRKNVTLTPVVGLHRKSLFVDDTQYIEGSYNWLSSARTLEDPDYFMETSILFRGRWAQELTRAFYHSNLQNG